MNEKIERLFTLNTVYDFADFYKIEKMDGNMGALRVAHKETGEVFYLKSFRVKDFIASSLYSAILEDQSPIQGLAFEIKEDGSKCFYHYSKSLGERIISTDNVIDSKYDNENNVFGLSSKAFDDKLGLGVLDLDTQNQPKEFQDKNGSGISIDVDVSRETSISEQKALGEIFEDLHHNAFKILNDTSYAKTKIIEVEDGVKKEFIWESSIIPFYELAIDEREDIVGLEKIVATCFLFNEYDYNPANILLRRSIDENGNECNIACKIDYEFSLGITPKTLSIGEIYELASSTYWIFPSSLPNYYKITEELENNMEFLRALNENNGEKFQDFLKFQIAYLYSQGVFESKEEAISELIKFRTSASIATDKHISILEEFIDHLDILNAASVIGSKYISNDLDYGFIGERKLEIYEAFTVVDIALPIHPLFTFMIHDVKVEGTDPVKWFELNYPKTLESLLHDYEEVRLEKDAIELNSLSELKFRYFDKVDTHLLSQKEIVSKYVPSLVDLIEEEYQSLLVGYENIDDMIKVIEAYETIDLQKEDINVSRETLISELQSLEEVDQFADLGIAIEELA